jgi:serine/threonine protein kinase
MSTEAETEILAQFLLARRIVTPEQLKEAFDAQAAILRVAGFPLELEEILLRKGLLNPQQLAYIQASLGHGRSDLIPGYEVLSKQGQGGMGAVYKARQTAMDRIVAIKVLLPHFAREKNAVDRFLREAKVLAKLSHPNLMRGIDAGFQKGLYYYVMEFFEGHTLEALLKRRGRLPLNEALSIVKQVTQGLDHAYGYGIVHRDIKPDNIMIDAAGQVKVTDLGLAKMVSGPSNSTLTQEGFVMGTPAYMSPEQARGEVEVDTRSDLYSLGLTFYEMLSGQRAHTGEGPVAIFQKKLKEDVPVDRLRPLGVPDGVIAVLRRMTARSREDRYQTPEELFEDLERIEQGTAPVVTVSASAPPPPATRRIARMTRSARAARSSSVTTWVTVGGVLLAAVAVYAVSVNFTRGRRPLPVARAPEAPAEPPANPNPPPEPPTPSPAPAPTAPVAPRIDPQVDESVWQAAVDYEKAFRETKPEDVLLNFVEAREKLLGTPRIVECERKVEEWKGRVDRAVEAARRQFQAEIEARLAAEEFGAARALTQAAQRRFGNPRLAALPGMGAYRDWGGFVRSEESKVETALDRAVAGLRRSAEALFREFRFAEARAAWERIRRFGIDMFAQEADERIGAIDKAAAAREEEMRRALEAERPRIHVEWRRCVQLARDRNYAEAAKPLASLLPSLRHPESTESARALLSGIGMAGSVLEDAMQAKGVDDESATDRILSAYKTARRSLKPEDQPLARLLFALFERELAEAETELKAFEKGGGKLRVEFEELLKELRNEEATRAVRTKEAADRLRTAVRDHSNPAKREQALDSMRTLLREYDDVLKRDQKNTILRYVGQVAKGGRREFVFHADEISKVNGRWKLVDLDNRTTLPKALGTDPGRGGAERFDRQSPDWFEIEVDVLADVEYTLWVHMSARNNGQNSIYAQIEDAIGGDGSPFFALDSDAAFILQYWRHGETQEFNWTTRNEIQSQAPCTFKFRASGKKRIRFFPREPGAMVDQIVLSADKYKSDPPKEHRLERVR